MSTRVFSGKPLKLQRKLTQRTSTRMLTGPTTRRQTISLQSKRPCSSVHAPEDVEERGPGRVRFAHMKWNFANP
ncbi:hypothetical protein OH76DRAFT_143967 [Lentinus brumalis]|uniref:Uncharacterized protein n=1 Tax=Lentinus brumalis TaxID=2498619 RepID=A0A371CPG0_9APHY|nr:hypothetical protein OH76DRAFT_143967 [Polyporus brumalis]